MNLPTSSNKLLAIQGMVDNGLVDLAKKQIKEWELKVKIVDGKVVDISESTDAWLSRFITCNPKMNELKADVRKLVDVQDEVLISGPTGTGKELLAHALHGERVGKFQGINCAGLPEHLIESELFGHVQGAFTGAAKLKDGLMKVASKGTLFLDEIGELPMQVQGKLLRAIQEKHIRKVGGDRDEEIDCRIVCATNRDLREMCSKNRFRLDLYARISVIELETISLQERPEDVIPIIESMPGGKEFKQAYDALEMKPPLDLSLNVRSLQKHVRRFKILGRLPTQ